MKNLILTSSGLKVQPVAIEVMKLLPKKPTELKIAHIITAANVAPDKDFVVKDKQAMLDLGFVVTDIELEKTRGSELERVLDQHDIIYVQGGNGFYLLKQIQESGFELILRKELAKGKWYIGVSAGTYVACPTIEMHTWKREVDNKYGLESLEAMSLVPFLISVHYNREKYRELLASKIPTASHLVRILTDEQAFVVRDDVVSLIGVGEEILAANIIG